MNSKQKSAFWQACEQHGQKIQERSTPGGRVVLICSCGFRTTVSHRNAMARNSKVHGAWMAHFRAANVSSIGAKTSEQGDKK